MGENNGGRTVEHGGYPTDVGVDDALEMGIGPFQEKDGVPHVQQVGRYGIKIGCPAATYTWSEVLKIGQRDPVPSNRGQR